MTPETGRLDGNTSVTSTMQSIPLSGRKNQNLAEMDSKQLLLKVLENQGDILKRVKKIEKALEGNEKGAAKCEEKTTVPLCLRNAVRNGYSDGEKKGMKWHFAGKRVTDEENSAMTKHIFMFVKGWNPKYSDPTVLNAAVRRYFTTKRQEDNYKKSERMQQRRKKECCMRERRRYVIKCIIG